MMCSFFNNLFTLIGNNNSMYSNNRIGIRNLIESEEFRETSNVKIIMDCLYHGVRA